jgi:hypothetical protein
MKRTIRKTTAVTVGIASLVLIVAATARSGTESAVAGQQRIMIETKERAGATAGRFTFHSSGAFERDSGTHEYRSTEKPRIVRDGQSISVYVSVSTFTGRRGTFTLRERLEVVGAGSGYLVGTGTWSFVRGTGDYTGVSGRGRLAAVRTLAGNTSALYEGLARTGS